jgi:hypothetical protein
MYQFKSDFESQTELLPTPKFESQPMEVETMGQMVELPDFKMDYSALDLINRPNATGNFGQQDVFLPEDKPVSQPISADLSLDSQDYSPSAQLSGGTMLSGASKVTQQFGNPNAGLYGYDKSGKARINRGTDIAMPKGSPQAAPPKGNWVAEKVVSNGQFNTGWGNYVLMRNTDTGETIQYSHLDKVTVKPGQNVTGMVVGTTGRSGRTTGYHADVEYTNNGQLQNVLTSPYRQYLGLANTNTKQGPKGGASKVAIIKEGIKSEISALRKALKAYGEGDQEARNAFLPPELYSPDALGFMAGGTTGKAFRIIHPEDRRLMMKLIDAVRVEKRVPEGLELDAARIAEHYGLKMPKSTTGLANSFDNTLQAIHKKTPLW